MNVDVFSPEAQALQFELIEQGYLPEVNSEGRSNADGYFSPVTHRAIQAREQDLVQIPEPPKPWYLSKTIIGLIVIIASQIAKGAGWEIESEVLTDAIVTGLDVIGAGMVWWGRVSASRPISKRAVLPGVVVGGADVVRQPERPTRLEDVPADRASDGEYWRRPRGPFDPE